MPQSLSYVLLHLVFSTKNREPWLDAEIRPRMHAYLAAIGRDNGSIVHRVGGVEDHVHLVATLPRTVTQSALLEAIKKHSSCWIKQIDSRYAAFSWQRGYGAFSVGRRQLDAIVRYVENQEEHHRQVPFQDEYRGLLTRHEIEFDERYVWD